MFVICITLYVLIVTFAPYYMLGSGKTISNSLAFPLFRFLSATIAVFLLHFSAFAQTTTDSAKISRSANIKDTSIISDTSSVKTKKDSLQQKGNLEQKLGIKISDDALDDVVVATATDSAVMDIKTNNFSLYGNAKVDYDGRKLSADRIDFNQSNNIATALVVDDTSKKPVPPTFEQGSEKFTYEHLQYNFKSQRAIVRNARSQYGEGFVHSAQVKRNADKSLYGYNNIYTTCSLPHPHFGIRTKKIKIIPEQAIASGSANIEIEGVPTPLFLPFGYFPVNNDKHRSGFILPGYVTDDRGLGFTQGGYYFHINDYVDLQLKTNIYTKGSFGGFLFSNYVTKYRYNGTVELSYAINKIGESYEPNGGIQKDYRIVWSHFKDAKSLPGVNFNANVNIVSQKFNVLNSYNVNQITQNQFQSNITFSKNWANKPFSLIAAARHNQNLVNKMVTVTLPEITFNVNPVNPFQRRNPIGQQRWYEKINVGYTLTAVNNIQFYDSAFDIGNMKADDFSNGLRHNIPVRATYNVLRFINLTFNADYAEYWNTKRSYLAFNDVSNKLDTTIDRGFAASRDFNGGFSLNTQIFGTKLFKKGAIRGLRHRLSPTVGFSYRPDFAKSPFNYGYQYRRDTTPTLYYASPFEPSVIGYPQVPGRNGLVTMGLNNNLQMKVRNKKDTATGFKNIGLLDRLDFNTSYNLAADSFQWADYVFSTSTTIANILSINASANFDPYAWDYNKNIRSTRTTLASGQGFGRLRSANLGFSTSLRSKPKESRTDAATQSEDYKSLMRNNGYNDYVDFNIPWSLSFTYSLVLTKTPSIYSRSDTAVLNQSVGIRGDFNFTPRWKIGVNTGYDLVNKQVTVTQIDLYRDLHCWEMSLGLSPFGTYRFFNFRLNVKAQVLQDLKLTRQRSFFTNQ